MQQKTDGAFCELANTAEMKHTRGLDTIDNLIFRGHCAMKEKSARPGQIPALQADRVLDCVALYCPEPLFRTRLAMEELPAGGLLEVLVDDPAAEADLRRFAGHNRHTVVKVSKEDGAVHILLRKGNGL